MGKCGVAVGMLMLGLVWFFGTSGHAASAAQASRRPVDFSAEIRPLLQGRCWDCHGPAKSKGGLRLDSRAAAVRGGDSGPALVPGEGAASRLVHRVTADKADELMPPKDPRLSVAEVALLQTWIDQGAVWPESGPAGRVRSDHWSFQPIGTPRVPTTAARVGEVESGNEVDAFIDAGLEAKGLRRSPPADRVTLLRRLTLDLTGLPPTPADVDAFVADRSASAYSRVVERLLASPRYGERWGRHWLDVARYTESQGFEYDRLRDQAWHYRDYVIASFNADKPYDRFMREQVAGDVLEPLTADGIIGASLLVCGPYDEAGNAQANQTQRAITREEEMEDTLSVVGQTFLGLTVNCARCHSHKFDPIPQDEYFRIKSVFDGVKHGERPVAGAEEARARELQIADWNRRIAEGQKVVARWTSEAWRRASAAKGADALPAGVPGWLQWRFASGGVPSGDGELKGNATVSDGALVLSGEGAYFQSAPFSRDLGEKTLEAWVSLTDLGQRGGAAISVETEDGRAFDAIVYGERKARRWMAGSEGFQRTQDLDGPEETASPGEWIHMAAVYQADGTVQLFRNGEPYGKSYRPSAPVRRFEAGKAHVVLGLRHLGGGKPWLNGRIRSAAVHDRALGADEIRTSFKSGGGGLSVEELAKHLSVAEREERAAAIEAIEVARAGLAKMPPVPASYAGTRVQPAPTRKLLRGDVKTPAEVVAPGALSALVDLDPEFGLAPDAPEAQRRLKFAEWLADPRNPLPARVMANRVWLLHFGQGLVATPNDFGAAGARPTHPELLDWLAGRFIESGWSVKALHRLILHSATYRQASAAREEAMEKDADTQWYWRYPPRRLEGESLRDAMLAASGQINFAMGGPSFRPFEILKFPANAYEPVDKVGPEFNRRTVYRMNVNSGKEPMMDAFDCPDPSVKTPKRGVTTTPLQALSLMNSSFVQRQASHLAERAQAEGGRDLARSVARAYRLALGRAATTEELERAVVAARERGLRSVCWALLNSTEFVYVR